MRSLCRRVVFISTIIAAVIFSMFSVTWSGRNSEAFWHIQDKGLMGFAGSGDDTGSENDADPGNNAGAAHGQGSACPNGNLALSESETGKKPTSGDLSTRGDGIAEEKSSLESFYIEKNKCYYSVMNDDKIKYLEAGYVDKTIGKPREITETKEPEPAYSEEGIIGRPLPVTGYFAGYMALKEETGQYSSVAYFKEDFQEHMDLFKIDISEGETTELVFASEDFRYFFYTQKDADTVRLMVFDLVENVSVQLHEGGKYYFIEREDEGFFICEALLKSGTETPVMVRIDSDVYRFYEENEKSSSDDSRNGPADGNAGQDDYDIVFENGIVIDPETETIKFGYNVGIIGDRIAAVTKQTIKGKRVFDTTGLVISPGFIDMLAFNLTSVAAKYKVLDGVTTSLSMHGCTVDYRGFFSQYGRNPPLVNYGGALFAVLLRRELGLGDYTSPNQKQIEMMAKRAREEIERGAIGVAFSPEYYPGTSPDEIRAIMKVAKEYNVPTHFHGRYSSLVGEFTSIDTVKEILGYAEELDAPVHFMHLHSVGGTGCMEEALQMINEARAKGYRVTYDIYPYDSWMSRLSMARFKGNWQERFDITYEDLQIPKMLKGLSPDLFAKYKALGSLCIAYAMEEAEIIMALKEEHCMIGSDDVVYTEGGANAHPRASGTFSRVIGKYSRDMDLFPLMDALKKMTINSAKHLEDIAPTMKVRGRLREDYVADITVFDYFSINDRSTAMEPALASDGISYVIVSGKIALDTEGLHPSAKSGKPIKGIFDPGTAVEK